MNPCLNWFFQLRKIQMCLFLEILMSLHSQVELRWGGFPPDFGKLEKSNPGKSGEAKLAKQCLRNVTFCF